MAAASKPSKARETALLQKLMKMRKTHAIELQDGDHECLLRWFGEGSAKNILRRLELLNAAPHGWPT
jgi:hypothetical protein